MTVDDLPAQAEPIIERLERDMAATGESARGPIELRWISAAEQLRRDPEFGDSEYLGGWEVVCGLSWGGVWDVASIVDFVQDEIIDRRWMDGHAAAWPECPKHPNSHPIRPDVDCMPPRWVCPKDRNTTIEMGRLTD